ncbi:hypothetical protein FRB99_000655 [Tulasnella sp. 403]|nr:hypothetical protein FRB99_000655 [Tulasnella sp. 403]
MSALLTSPSAFAPRKEFLKSQTPTHHFALLAFNGADILRLSNFPRNVIASLRSLFETQKVYRIFREDAEMGVSEFVMSERVWTGKSIRTERLITLIFSTILSHNFRYVTSLSYGRLADDSRSLVFSKLTTSSLNALSSSHANSPAVNASPLPSAAPSLPAPPPSDSGVKPEQRSCFALSFTSRALRVICAPKSSTPAILASVRAAWPRGIVSEGSSCDDVYEFQLKGYSLFSSSTFDRDALIQIFSLLRSLDVHGFQLVTNFNLSQGIARSRTKDLWIFDAPAEQPTPPASGSAAPSPKSSLLRLPSKGRETSVATSAGMAGLGAGYNAYLTPAEGVTAVQQHARAATSPSPLGRDRHGSMDSSRSNLMLGGNVQGHVRSVSNPTPEKSGFMSRAQSVLRKAPPPTYMATMNADKPQRRNSKSSVRQAEKQVESPLPLSPVVVEPPAPLAPQTPASYESQNTSTPPLAESEYAYGYASYAAGQGGNGTETKPSSEYMYKRYEPPTPGAMSTLSPTAVIYSTTGAEGSSSRATVDEGLLSADAFRETAYSGTEVPLTWTGSPSDTGSPTTTDLQHGHRHTRESSQVTPRTGHAPLPIQPERIGSTPQLTEGRPKSEKALLGVIPSPPATSYPPISGPHRNDPSQAGRVSIERVGSTSSTVLPPGGYPKSSRPSMDGQPSVTAGPPLSTTGLIMAALDGRNRKGSYGTTTTSRTGPKRSGSKGSTRPGSPSKGWVLVNVEPKDQRGSIDDRDGGPSSVIHRQPESPVSPVSAATMTKLKTGDIRGALPALDSPLEASEASGHAGARSFYDAFAAALADQNYAPGDALGPRPRDVPGRRKNKGSLRRKRRSSTGDEHTVRRKFLGIFTRNSKEKTKEGPKSPSKLDLHIPEPAQHAMLGEHGELTITSPVEDKTLMGERDDSRGAVDGVKSSWRFGDPKAPTRVSKLTIG